MGGVEMSVIHVGDKVRYSSDFLHNTGQMLGVPPFARGVVVALEPLSSETMLARIDWGHDGGELPEKVNVVNLEKVKYPIAPMTIEFVGGVYAAEDIGVPMTIDFVVEIPNETLEAIHQVVGSYCIDENQGLWVVAKLENCTKRFVNISTGKVTDKITGRWVYKSKLVFHYKESTKYL
jgi:hypothetical protein